MSPLNKNPTAARLTGKILVTGSSGNVGKEVFRILKEAGLSPRDGRNPATGESFRFHRPETWEAALEGVTRVFLMRPPALSNVRREMEPFLGELARRKMELTVFLSVQGAEKMGFIPHAKIEQALVTRNLPAVFLRPSFFMQNLETPHGPEIRDLSVLMVPAGRGTTNFIHVRDIAEAAVRELTAETIPASATPRCHTLLGPRDWTYHEIADLLSGAVDRKITYPAPGFLSFLAFQLGRGTELPKAMTMGLLYTLTRLGKAGSRGEPGSLEALIDHPPRTLEDYIRENADQWKTQTTASAGASPD